MESDVLDLSVSGKVTLLRRALFPRPPRAGRTSHDRRAHWLRTSSGHEIRTKSNVTT